MKYLKPIAAILICTLVLGCAWKGDEIKRLMAVNTLFDADKIVYNFSNTKASFHFAPIDKGTSRPSPLEQGKQITFDAKLNNWLAERSATAVIVLKSGKIVAEHYYQGTQIDDHRISWSVAKSFMSALLGVLIEEGAIESIDDPVIKYAPELEQTAYKSASIRNVLNMASGVKFNEDYLDPSSDINKMGRAIALGKGLDQFTYELTESFAPAGQVWQYASIDTHVLGMVIRGATGRTIPDLMGEKIISPLGLEGAPFYTTDTKGVAFVLGGLNMMTRDYARFGQMILQNGYFNGKQIVPDEWVAASTRPSAPSGAPYGYQWWIPKGAPEGIFLARGVYGQYIYIDQNREVVITMNAADRNFREYGVSESYIRHFVQIAKLASP